MVEVGSIEIGGSIKTSEIERGMTRIESGMKNISNSAKSVEGDFERISARGGRLVKIFGGLAIAGGGALLALSKGAPALAGSMAKIDVSMLKLKMSAGEALKPTFDKAAEALNKLAGWVDAHPDMFRGIVNSITGLAIATGAVKVGGWVYTAWTGFFGMLKGMVKWSGWSTLATKIADIAGKAAGIIGRVTGGIAGGLGVGASTAAIALGPLINTYQREITGEPGFMDKWLQQQQQSQFQQQLFQWSRNKGELDNMNFI